MWIEFNSVQYDSGQVEMASFLHKGTGYIFKPSQHINISVKAILTRNKKQTNQAHVSL